MRNITCWTLSRYARWIIAQKDEDQYFRALMVALLERILDTSKKVPSSVSVSVSAVSVQPALPACGLPVSCGARDQSPSFCSLFSCGFVASFVPCIAQVQEAACSAFATFEEEAGVRLLPYLEGILKNLM